MQKFEDCGYKRLTTNDLEFDGKIMAPEYGEVIIADDKFLEPFKRETDGFQNYYDSLPEWKKEWFLEITILINKQNNLPAKIMHECICDCKAIKLEMRIRKSIRKNVDNFYKWYTMTYIVRFIKYKILGIKI